MYQIKMHIECGILTFFLGPDKLRCWLRPVIIIIIMYIYHALINALSAHLIDINLSMIFYTHVEHTPTKRFT